MGSPGVSLGRVLTRPKKCFREMPLHGDQARKFLRVTKPQGSAKASNSKLMFQQVPIKKGKLLHFFASYALALLSAFQETGCLSKLRWGAEPRVLLAHHTNQ